MKRVLLVLLALLIFSVSLISLLAGGAAGRGIFSPWGGRGSLRPSQSSAPRQAAAEVGSVLPATELSGSNRTVAQTTRALLRIPILMYHRIGEPADGLTVTPKDFAQQMRFLAEQGYRTITLSQLLQEMAALTGSRDARSLAEAGDSSQPREPSLLAGKVVVLTFDDGYDSVFLQAFPVLKKYHFTATVFPITGLVGKKGFLNWDEMKEMADYGVDVGSHTVHHPDLRYLRKGELEQEIEDSRQILLRRLGQSVRAFCYPAGKYNPQVLEEVRRAGYLGAVTTEYGAVTLSDDPYRLRRIRIDGRENGKVFAAKLLREEPKAVVNGREDYGVLR
ncbi:MAG: polysaccharide deacetylase family protein [Firmicutes bacterium]|nr:polysaccharide deacetylase family protein [Bacillota bacterium]MCL5039954.1 polysaccharide deacetylase family protein [Bacillota bacterium]